MSHMTSYVSYLLMHRSCSKENDLTDAKENCHLSLSEANFEQHWRDVSESHRGGNLQASHHGVGCQQGVERNRPVGAILRVRLVMGDPVDLTSESVHRQRAPRALHWNHPSRPGPKAVACSVSRLHRGRKRFTSLEKII